jgi:hypothetical protein
MSLDEPSTNGDDGLAGAEKSLDEQLAELRRWMVVFQKGEKLLALAFITLDTVAAETSLE